jgi:predicted nucleic acid-binding protein
VKKVFVDTDVALDLLSAREPHYIWAAQLFTLADKGKVKAYISALSFSNLHYLLTRQYNAMESRRILKQFKVVVKVLPVDEKIIDLALSSVFTDLEDAIQYYTALENAMPLLLTRNIKDYKQAAIGIMTPEAFIKHAGPSQTKL